MAKIFGFLTVIFLLVYSLPGQAYSKSISKDPSPEQVRSTMQLKQYMADFGTLVAGMEILRLKEKTPDWEAIDLTLKEMEGTLRNMQDADKASDYKEFTDVLTQNLKEVQAYGKKRDKKIYNSFDKLTDTCFKCHAAHRPSDFLMPKDKDPRMGQTSRLLFVP